MLTPNTISPSYFKPGVTTPVVGARTHVPMVDNKGRWLLPSQVPFLSFSEELTFVGTGENYNVWLYRDDGVLPGPSPFVRNIVESRLWHYFTLNTSGSSWTITPSTTETVAEYSRVRALDSSNLYGFATERSTYYASFPAVYTSNTTKWTYALLRQWHQLTSGEDSTLEPIAAVDPANGHLPLSLEACGTDVFVATTETSVEINLEGYTVATTDHTSRLRSSASGSAYNFSGSATGGSYQSHASSQRLFGWLGRRGGTAAFTVTGVVTIPKTFDIISGDTLYPIAATGRVVLHVYRSTNHSASTSTSDASNVAIATVAHTFVLDQTIELAAFNTAIQQPSADVEIAIPSGVSLDLHANTPYLFRLAIEGTAIASETPIEDPSASMPLDSSVSMSTSSHCQLPARVKIQIVFP